MMTMPEYLRLMDDGNPNCGEIPRIVFTQAEITAVMEDHEPLVTRITQRVGASFPTVDRDDLASEIRLRILRSAHTFDPYSGRKFVNYAMIWAIRRAKEWAWRGLGKGLKGVPPSGTFVGSLTDLEGQQYSVPDNRTYFENNDDFWERVTKGMSTLARAAIITRFRDGETNDDTAKKLGIDRRYLDRLLYLALGAIRSDSTQLKDHLR